MRGLTWRPWSRRGPSGPSLLLGGGVPGGALLSPATVTVTAWQVFPVPSTTLVMLGTATVTVGVPQPTPSRQLLVALAGVAGTDSYQNAYPAGAYAYQVTLAPVNAAPGTPASGCILYYTGGALYALGPSGTPVKLATT